ncbi:MAG TPA: sodium:solute symporter, partial [Marmoricola sp.]
QVINPATGKHFGGSLAEIPGLGDMGYIALTAFVLNLLVAAVVSAVLNATKVSNGRDATRTSDYYADKDDPTVAHDLQRANDLEAPPAR